MSHKEVLINQITDAMRSELISVPGTKMSVSDIDHRISDLEQEFRNLFEQSKNSGGYMEYADQFKQINDQVAMLKKQRTSLLDTQAKDSATNHRISTAVQILSHGSEKITQWDESMIRQLVDTIKVLPDKRIRIYIQGGIEIEQCLDTESLNVNKANNNT